MKKQVWFVFLGVVMATAACTSATQTPTPQSQAAEIETVVASTMQAYTASPEEAVSTQAATQTTGIPVSLEYTSFVIPDGLATGASTDKMTAIESNSTAPWDVAPTHLRFTLTGYLLQARFHEPRIYVYPAADYARSNPTAAEQINRVNRLLGGTALLKETLPSVPFFNAAPLIAARIRLVPFQNGNGVRALTQYAQYAAPINNRELFYHYQGLTNDGQYYVIAILPVTAPVLAEDEKPEASVPNDGVPIPDDGPDETYYFSVNQKLNSVSLDSYTPTLNELDALVQSILVTNP